MELLRTIDLKKQYGEGDKAIYALDGVNISVKLGEFISVMGTSGSGKSTLLNILGGLDNPTSGEVIIQDKNLFSLSNEEMTVFRRQKIGFIFQDYNLLPILNIFENIVLPIELNSDKIDGEFVNHVIEVLGIQDKIYNMPNTLSGGQQQRVAIARAIVTKPAIILADEPTGNLDSKTSIDVVKLMKKCSERFNQTVLIITHNEKIAQMTDRIIHIEDGHIVTDSSKCFKTRRYSIIQ